MITSIQWRFDQGTRWLLLTDSSSSKTAVKMGHIIAIAAVFEIHIDTNIVTATKPKFSLKNEDESIINHMVLVSSVFASLISDSTR